jgi:CHAT domain-containing protein/tetratricopeptide (TPR) repeat protein
VTMNTQSAGSRRWCASAVCLLVAILAVQLLPHCAYGQQSGAGYPNTSYLMPGRPIQADLHGGETHSYRIRAGAGQFLHVSVEQQGIHVVLSLFAPDGQPVARTDMLTAEGGIEPVSTIAATSGDFRLDITSSQSNAAPGRYIAKLTDLRAPTADDRTRITAERTYMEGVQFLQSNDAESKKAAIPKWQQSADLWRTLNDTYEEAVAVNSIAWLSNITGDKQKALDSLLQVAPLWHATGAASNEASTYSNIGALYADIGQKQKALDYDSQALTIRRGIGDRNGEAISLQAIGKLYFNLGDNQKALDYYNQALAARRALGDRSGEALMLFAIGSAYINLGDYRKALDYFNQSLPIVQAVGNHSGEATVLFNLGTVYYHLDDNQKAVDSLNEAGKLQMSLGDRSGVASTLSRLGQVYAAMGEKQKALACFTQALPLEHALGDKVGESATLNGAAQIFFDLGQNDKGLEMLNRALELERAGGDKAGEAQTLTAMGDVYSKTGQKQKALDSFQQALSVEQAAGDRNGEAVVLVDLALLYRDLGETDKELDALNQAVAMEHAAGDRGNEARTLESLASFYSGTDKQKALDDYTQALTLSQQVGDRPVEAEALAGLGGVYWRLGDKQKGLDDYTQALTLSREAGDRQREASILAYMADFYSQQGDKQKSLDYYNQVLAIDRTINDLQGEAAALNLQGAIYFGLGDMPKALDAWNQALPLYHSTGDMEGESEQMLMLMAYWYKQQNLDLSIFYGKESIQLLQEVRQNLQGMSTEAQQGFMKSRAVYYRGLANVLIKAGRFSEAQQVLDLVKGAEFAAYTQTRGGGDTGLPPANVVLSTPAEKKSAEEYQKIAEDVTAIGQQWSQLNAKSPRTPEEEQNLKDLSAKLTAANQQMQTFFTKLYSDFGSGDVANARVASINEETGGLQELIKDPNDRIAVIYTLVLDDKLVVMVITPATRVAREVTITKSQLHQKVFSFARALQGHQSDESIQAKSQDLYNVLIAPIEKDLEGAQADTLVWSLDDVLRYVPMAALYDGKHYLVERYRNVVITMASIGNLQEQPQKNNLHALAMGISKDYDHLGELKAVPGELDSVIHSDAVPGSHGPLAGTIMLNDAFTKDSMEAALEQHPSLVHIASHYVFRSGDDTASYLLVGGDTTGGQGYHLTLADIRDDQRMDFSGTELLTLSGCQTAVGSKEESDGREIDGLGIVAQRKHAKAVIATLWPVDDASVGLLMADFYRGWVTKPGMTKAEALRQAQLALLHGTSGGTNASGSSATGSGPAAPYANPYYWAPFILIGNWK